MYVRVYFYVSVYMCVQGAPYVCASMGQFLYMLVRLRVYVSVYTSTVLCLSRCVYMNVRRDVCVPLEKCYLCVWGELFIYIGMCI